MVLLLLVVDTILQDLHMVMALHLVPTLLMVEQASMIDLQEEQGVEVGGGQENVVLQDMKNSKNQIQVYTVHVVIIALAKPCVQG